MKGHCLCGAVQFEAPDAVQKVGVCHCEMCRRWGGSAFLELDCGADVRFSGEEHIARFASSDWAERAFCKTCGTHLFYRYKPTGNHSIPVGLFEQQDDLSMDTQIFIDEKPAYYNFAEETEKLTGAEVIAKFGAAPD